MYKVTFDFGKLVQTETARSFEEAEMWANDFARISPEVKVTVTTADGRPVTVVTGQ